MATVVQQSAGIIYDLTLHSWAAVSILAKYYLILAIGYLYTEGSLTRERFEEKLLEDSRFVLAAIVALGIFFYLINTNPNPVVKVLSEILALAYLAFLFWKY